jgi:hypothetical protein
MALKHGPVGDKASADPFERAQAHAPKGWHVEGQIMQPGFHWSASGPNAEGVLVHAYTWHAADIDDAVAQLIAEMRAKALESDDSE